MLCVDVHKRLPFSNGEMLTFCCENRILNTILRSYNLIVFMFIRFPAILLIKTIDSCLHEFCARGILHSDFQ